MDTRNKIVNAMGKLLFNGHASVNYNHVETLARKLKEYDEKHPVKE